MSEKKYLPRLWLKAFPAPKEFLGTTESEWLVGKDDVLSEIETQEHEAQIMSVEEHNALLADETARCMAIAARQLEEKDVEIADWKRACARHSHIEENQLDELAKLKEDNERLRKGLEYVERRTDPEQKNPTEHHYIRSTRMREVVLKALATGAEKKE